MMDLINAAESIESPSPINNGKFFKVIGIMFVIGWIVAIALPTGVHTSLTQNIVKTTLVVYVGFSIFYSFICLYRVLAKKKIIRTLKEILLTLVFMLWLYNCLVLIDMPPSILASSAIMPSSERLSILVIVRPDTTSFFISK